MGAPPSPCFLCKSGGLPELGGGSEDISGTLASSSDRLSQAHCAHTRSFSTFPPAPRTCPGIAAKWLVAMGGEVSAAPKEVRPEREDRVDQRGSGGIFFFKVSWKRRNPCGLKAEERERESAFSAT